MPGRTRQPVPGVRAVACQLHINVAADLSQYPEWYFQRYPSKILPGFRGAGDQATVSVIGVRGEWLLEASNALGANASLGADALANFELVLGSPFNWQSMPCRIQAFERL